MDIGIAEFIKDKDANLFKEEHSQNNKKNLFVLLFKKKKKDQGAKWKKIELMPQCYYCQGKVELWDTNKKPCPCCGGTMKMKEDRMSVTFWD